MSADEAARASADEAAARGWPAYMTAEDLRAQNRKFRVVKSLLGRRVRIMHASGAWLEYAREPSGFYRRADGRAESEFPEALARREISRVGSSRHMPHEVSLLQDGTAVLVHPGTNRAATYTSRDGIWQLSQQLSQQQNQLQTKP
jgi:hypothetical protein